MLVHILVALAILVGGTFGMTLVCVAVLAAGDIVRKKYATERLRDNALSSVVIFLPVFVAAAGIYLTAQFA